MASWCLGLWVFRWLALTWSGEHGDVVQCVPGFLRTDLVHLPLGLGLIPTDDILYTSHLVAMRTLFTYLTLKYVQFKYSLHYYRLDLIMLIPQPS